MKLVFKWPNKFKSWILSSLWPTSQNDLDLWYSCTMYLHVPIYMNASSNFEIIGCNSFRNCFSLAHVLTPKWSWRKIGQGQPSVIISRILVILAYRMLHIKFQVHRSLGSGEECFFIFTIYGHCGNIGHVTQTIWITFRTPIPGGLMRIWLESALWFQRRSRLKF